MKESVEVQPRCGNLQKFGHLFNIIYKCNVFNSVEKFTQIKQFIYTLRELNFTLYFGK